jgi:hypothetical protein
MKVVPENAYNESIGKIYDWYKNTVYDEENYTVELTEMPGTHLKMIEVLRKQTGGLYNKILVKATYDDIRQAGTPRRNVEELTYLYNIKTAHRPSEITAHQVLWVQLDGGNDQTDALLFTWSPHDESYHKFEI